MNKIYRIYMVDQIKEDLPWSSKAFRHEQTKLTLMNFPT